MGKYQKKSCSFELYEEYFFKFVFKKYAVQISRRHYQKSKMSTLGVN
jgi:hypothetical protein